MLNKLLLVWRNKEANQVTASFMLVLFVSALFSGHAVAQTEQTSLLPGNGAPLLVTPEVHLTSPAPPVGASNATAGNTAGATNATVRRATHGQGPRRRAAIRRPCIHRHDHAEPGDTSRSSAQHAGSPPGNGHPADRCYECDRRQHGGSCKCNHGFAGHAESNHHGAGIHRSGEHDHDSASSGRDSPGTGDLGGESPRQIGSRSCQ